MSKITYEDFGNENPPSRIIGSEAEITALPNAYVAARAIVKDVRKYGRALGIRSVHSGQETDRFLSNGARMYFDVGHVEWASGESDGPLDAVCTDDAGQKIPHKLAARYRTDEGEEVVPLFRRVGYAEYHNAKVSRKATTSGYHENYLVTPETDNEYSRLVLESYLATRNIWAGMGMVHPDGFHISQKAYGIGDGVIGQDGAINRTAEGRKAMGVFYGPSSGKNYSSAWGRFEVRSAESHSSKWARFMSFATTSLVLRMLEHNVPIGDDMIFKSPVQVVRGVSTDPLMQNTYETLSGKRISALEHQYKLALAARELSKRINLPPDEQYAADEWVRICEDMAGIKDESDYLSVASRVEWAARHTVLRRKFGDVALTSMNHEVRAFDINWDRLGPKGLANFWWRRQQLDPEVFDKERAEKYQTDPPENTRAHPRGKRIARLHKRITRIGWDYLHYTNSRGITSKSNLSHPYRWHGSRR